MAQRWAARMAFDEYPCWRSETAKGRPSRCAAAISDAHLQGLMGRHDDLSDVACWIMASENRFLVFKRTPSSSRDKTLFAGRQLLLLRLESPKTYTAGG